MIGYYLRKVSLARDLIVQHLRTPDIAIIGSVHRENTGDMALAKSVVSVLKSHGFHTGMQCFGKGPLGLQRWPKGSGRAIIAGGAIGREKLVRSLAERFQNDPERVALVGVSFWSLNDLSKVSVEFLRRVGYISCRNRQDSNRLENVGIGGVHFAFDNAFLLPKASETHASRQLGVNVVSRHMRRDGDRYIPTQDNPSFGPAYIRVMRAIIESYLQKGWHVKHVPFTKDDERFASYVFAGLDVSHRSYTHRVKPVYSAVATCSRFIGTRYHAHIFALTSRVPLLSFSYAKKCSCLQEDLNIPARMQATRREVMEQEQEISDRFSSERGFILDEERLAKIQHGVRDNIKTAMNVVSTQ